MTTVYNYDFSQVSLTVDGDEISAFDAGDDVITLTRRVDSMSDVMGANGDMMVSNQTDRSGTITFRLLQGSESNNTMYELLAVQESGTFTPFAVVFSDTLTGDAAAGTQGYIQKPATMTRGVNANAQEWTIVVSNLALSFAGGNAN